MKRTTTSSNLGALGSLEERGNEEPGRGRTAILVLGSHRSGTSAFTRVFNLLGAALPTNLIPPAGDNPAGFWESREIVEIHDSMLREAGSAWDDPMVGSLEASEAAAFENRLFDVVKRDFERTSLFVLKDPRLCSFVPTWIRVLERLDANPRFVLTVRNPLEVAESLRARDGLPLTRGLLLWLHALLDSERETRGYRRAFASYDGLLADWRGTVGRLTTAMDLPWPRRLEDAAPEIEAFLSKALRHHEVGANDLETRPEVNRWVRDAFRIARMAAEDAEARFEDELDRIRVEAEREREAYAPFLRGRKGLLKRLEAVEKESEAKQKWILQIEGDNRELKTGVESLERTLEAKAARIAGLEADIASLTRSSDAKEARIAGLEAANRHLHQELREIRASLAWRLILGYRHAITRLFPPKTRRHRLYHGTKAVFGLVRLSSVRSSLAWKPSSIRARFLDRCREAFASETSITTPALYDAPDRPEVAGGTAKPAIRPADDPLIQIIVVSYDSARHVSRLVASLRRLERPIGARVSTTFVDNASRDDTASRIEDACAAENGSWRLIRNRRNKGFGRAINDVADPNATYLFLVNPDLELAKDCLRELFAVAESDPTIGVCEARQFPYEHPKFYDPVTLETSWSSGAALLVRSEAFQRCRGFDPALFLYVEDVDLSWSLRRSGYSCRYVPKALVWHYTYENPGQVKVLQRVYGMRNSLLLRLKWANGREVSRGLRGAVAEWANGGRRQDVARAVNGFFTRGPAMIFRRWARRIAVAPRIASFRGWDYELHRPYPFFASRPPKSDPLVTIIVRTSGRPERLRDTLRTVANQTYPRIEVVVVEDGGETSRETAESFSTELAVRYLSLGGKKGRSDAGNAGLRAAKGELVNFLDDDDFLLADHVETLVAALEESPEMPAAYSLAWELEEQTRTPTPGWRRGARLLLGPDAVFDHDVLSERNLMPIQAVLFRHELFARYGGFNESLEYLEDWDLWRRYSAAGPFLRVEKVTSIYTVRGPARADRQRALDSALEVARGVSAGESP